MTEEEIAQRCSLNDREAGDELFRRYADRLFPICLRYSSSTENAEDLLQEVMTKAFFGMSGFSYRGEGSLYGWIRRLTINLAISKLRKDRFRVLPLSFLHEAYAEDPTEQDIENIPIHILLDMISHLPSRQRAVFNLYCIDGYSHREIARLLNITEKGSAGILAKARAQLKKNILSFRSAQK